MSKELSDEQIRDFLCSNSIGRNNQLACLVRYLVSLDMSESNVIALDNNWGEGKTVFLRQLYMLNKEADLTVGDAESEDAFRKKFKATYFNAWENDDYENPLVPLVLRIAKGSKGGKIEECIAKLVASIDIKGALAELAKRKTCGFINPDRRTPKQMVVSLINSENDKRKAVSDILRESLNGKDVRHLVVIDELDRCKPSFAVELLETLKHYFDTEGAVFILAINGEQLANSVKKYYGESYDGYGYLERFFDFSMRLKHVDVRSYYQNCISDKYRQFSYLDESIIDFLYMTPRQINNYYKIGNLAGHYIRSTSYSADPEPFLFARCLFVPMAAALLAAGDARFDDYIRGKSCEVLIQMSKSYEGLQRFITKNMPQSMLRTDNIVISRIEKLYSDMFNDGQYAQDVQDALTMMGRYTPTNGNAEDLQK